VNFSTVSTCTGTCIGARRSHQSTLPPNACAYLISGALGPSDERVHGIRAHLRSDFCVFFERADMFGASPERARTRRMRTRARGGEDAYTAGDACSSFFRAPASTLKGRILWRGTRASPKVQEARGRTRWRGGRVHRRRRELAFPSNSRLDFERRISWARCRMAPDVQRAYGAERRTGARRSRSSSFGLLRHL